MDQDAAKSKKDSDDEDKKVKIAAKDILQGFLSNVDPKKVKQTTHDEFDDVEEDEENDAEYEDVEDVEDSDDDDDDDDYLLPVDEVYSLLHIFPYYSFPFQFSNNLCIYLLY